MEEGSLLFLPIKSCFLLTQFSICKGFEELPDLDDEASLDGYDHAIQNVSLELGVMEQGEKIDRYLAAF